MFPCKTPLQIQPKGWFWQVAAMPPFVQPSCLPLPSFQAEWPHFQWSGDQNSAVERLLQHLAMTGEGDSEQRGLFELFQVLVKEDTQIQRFATQKKVGFASSCVAAFK